MSTISLIETECDSTAIATVMRQAQALARRNAMRRNHGLLEKHWPAREVYAQIMDLPACAAQQFAQLNGWLSSPRSFRPATLARGGCHDSHDRWGTSPWWPHALLDHPLFFRESARPYRTAAAVGQPYGTSLETAREIAAGLGLIVHAPPDLTASWWAPGHSRFFVITRPSVTEVEFLPDQYYTELEWRS